MNWPLRTKIVEKFGTQADFAHAIKSAEAVVSKVIRGRRVLAEEERKRWADALGAEIAELFGEEIIDA
jgi:plasmid maintenance system antidote protein VapI